MVLNDAGVIGLTLNGKSFPATDADRRQHRRLDPAHLLQRGPAGAPDAPPRVPQLVVAKDGDPLDQPYSADTVLVAPGERYTVLINPTVAGTWVWHCHILNHVESDDGMFGMVTALVVQ